MKIKATPNTGVVVKVERGESELPLITPSPLNLRKILVPVDFSECSRKALHYATALAKQSQAEILLLHVLEMPPVPVQAFEAGFAEGTPEESAANELSEWQAQAGSPAPVKTLVCSGSASPEIVRTADENNMDLIVIGSHGRTGLARLLLGSTAERVVRHAPCPVLVVREREHDFVAPPEGRASAKA
jgi:nucleotide-binding universal stress UspA family protein